jgi:hypothetical protein
MNPAMEMVNIMWNHDLEAMANAHVDQLAADGKFE